MAKKIISYKLNSDGTIPDYVEDGGYLPKNPGEIETMILLGVSKDGADTSNAEAEFANEADAIAYVNTYLSNATFTTPTGEERIFVVTDAVAGLFAKLTQ